MKEIHLKKTLNLIDEAQHLAMRDGEMFLAFLLQLASLAASERIEAVSQRDLSEDYDEN